MLSGKLKFLVVAWGKPCHHCSVLGCSRLEVKNGSEWLVTTLTFYIVKIHPKTRSSLCSVVPFRCVVSLCSLWSSSPIGLEIDLEVALVFCYHHHQSGDRRNIAAPRETV